LPEYLMFYPRGVRLEDLLPITQSHGFDNAYGRRQAPFLQMLFQHIQSRTGQGHELITRTLQRA
jgi:hypothetical protein